jgi:hypothetical protein
MHYFLVSGPLALFVQAAFGGVYMNAAERTEDVNNRFAACARLIQAIGARRADAADADRRLLVLDLDQPYSRASMDRHPDHRESLDQLIPAMTRPRDGSPLESALDALDLRVDRAVDRLG